MELPPYEFKIIADQNAHIVQMTGEIDYAASLEILPQLRELTGRCCADLLLDLDEVTFIDSEGIKTLIAAATWMQERQGQARVVRCSPCVHRVLRLTGLEFLLSSGCATVVERS